MGERLEMDEKIEKDKMGRQRSTWKGKVEGDGERQVDKVRRWMETEMERKVEETYLSSEVSLISQNCSGQTTTTASTSMLSHPDHNDSNISMLSHRPQPQQVSQCYPHSC